MSWLDALGVATSYALRNIIGEASNPNKVLDVKSGQYSNRFIHCREEALVLYGPSKEGLRTQDKYEIVLHRPCSESLHQAFRLVRVALKYCNMYFIIFLL
jgi:calcium-independent phospholipase A2